MDDTAPDLPLPPYYSRNFFDLIKDVKQNTPLNPVHMSVKEWYRHILEKYVTMNVIDDEGRMTPKLCKVEELEPLYDWPHGYHFARLKGLAPQVKSFNCRIRFSNPC